jgi:hypothetical protein
MDNFNFKVVNPNSEKTKESNIFRLVWNLIDKHDKVLLILPNLTKHTIENEYILSYFRETIKSIYKSEPTIVVCFVEGIYFTNDIIKAYEYIYDIEIQWLTNIELIKNEDFMKYHKPKMMYFLKSQSIPLIEPLHFDKCIIDTMNLSKSTMVSLDNLNISLHYGKCVFEEFINVKIYLNKLMTRLTTSLEKSLDTNTNIGYNDIAFIIGNTKLPIRTITSILNKTIKTDSCALVFNCNNSLTSNIKVLENNKSRYATSFVYYEEATICIDVFSDLTERLDKLSSLHTTYIFIGSFDFNDNDIKTKWYNYIEHLENASIYDIDAFSSLLRDIKDNAHLKKFRISNEITTVIDIFISKNTDVLELENHNKRLKQNDNCENDWCDYDEEYEEDY